MYEGVNLACFASHGCAGVWLSRFAQQGWHFAHISSVGIVVLSAIPLLLELWCIAEILISKEDYGEGLGWSGEMQSLFSHRAIQALGLLGLVYALAL